MSDIVTQAIEAAEEPSVSENAGVTVPEIQAAELDKNGIKPEKIYVDVNISENNCISISKIKLVFVDVHTFEAERAVSIAEEMCGHEITGGTIR